MNTTTTLTETPPTPRRFALTIQGLRVVSEANQRAGHWAARHKRNRAQQDIVLASLARLDKAVVRAGARCRVTLTRIMGKGGQRLDGDNLAGAFKHVRDAVAGWAGVDDGDPWWVWIVSGDQERGAEYGVRIELEAMP